MAKPIFTDYVGLIYTLFDKFAQDQKKTPKPGHPFDFKDQSFLIFLLWMQMRHITAFKAQHRWLKQHPEHLKCLNFKRLPHRTTISRRYKALYDTLQDFIAFVGNFAQDLEPDFRSKELFEDKSLFKAKGPVWHQKDRKRAHIPDKLRNLDRDATWCKSAYHGWVYGYGLHVTSTENGFPRLVSVKTASISESQVIQEKEAHIFKDLDPYSVTADNAYTKAMRIRQWAKAGKVLITPAIKWVKGHYAKNYHLFLQRPENQDLMRLRKTAIEPIFDLIAKLIDATDNHKQIAYKRLENVQTYLALAVFTLQLAMIMNSVWGMPIRAIAHIKAVWP